MWAEIKNMWNHAFPFPTLYYLYIYSAMSVFPTFFFYPIPYDLPSTNFLFRTFYLFSYILKISLFYILPSYCPQSPFSYLLTNSFPTINSVLTLLLPIQFSLPSNILSFFSPSTIFTFFLSHIFSISYLQPISPFPTVYNSPVFLVFRST